MIDKHDQLRRQLPIHENRFGEIAAIPADVDLRERLHALLLRQRMLPAQLDLMGQGSRSSNAFILRGGWAYSACLLPNGRRQIINFHLPGEFLGLHTLLLPQCDRSYVSLTTVAVCEVPRRVFIELVRDDPEVAALLACYLSGQCATAAAQLANVGRRNAKERVAYLLCDIARRLSTTDSPEQLDAACPITQEHLADAAGLSVVYVNRILQNFSDQGFLSLRFGRLAIFDFPSLAEMAESDLGAVPASRYAEPCHPDRARSLLRDLPDDVHRLVALTGRQPFGHLKPLTSRASTG